MTQPTEWPNLEFEADSFVGPFNQQSVSGFESWLHRNGRSAIKFDATYLEFLKHHHGGSPRKKNFVTCMGTDHVLEDFGHFDDTLQASNPLQEYHVATMWSNASDRLGPCLMPFAELFAGDMLCFDHAKPGRPKVVV